MRKTRWLNFVIICSVKLQSANNKHNVIIVIHVKGTAKLAHRLYYVIVVITTYFIKFFNIEDVEYLASTRLNVD